jgi:uncharacterized membrane protein HdeD (DUF308 family)
MVSPFVLVIPIIALLAAIAIITFGILWLIAYLRKRKEQK